MIRRAPAPNDERLEAMIRAIVDGVQPKRVILFGSRARGDARPDSDYDLVVELPFERAEYYQTHGRVSAALRGAKNGAAIDLLIRTPGEIEQKRDDPGYMDWEIARDGIILYPIGSDSEALRPRIGGAVREDEPLASIADWLARAAEDARAIDAMLDSPRAPAWSAIAFHAQQLAEKHLKVLFIVQHARPPRTHDVGELVAELRILGCQLSDFAAECELLKDYAVDVRYPEQVPIPDEAKGRAVLAAAHRIVEEARGRLDR